METWEKAEKRGILDGGGSGGLGVHASAFVGV